MPFRGYRRLFLKFWTKNGHFAFLASYGGLGATCTDHIRLIGNMGVDHGGRGGQVPPEIGVGVGGASANCPPQIFVIQIQKGAFCGLQNTPKSVFGRGSAPDPVGGAPDSPPDPLVGWRGDTPHHTPKNPPHSASTHLRRSPCVPLRIPARSTPMLAHFTTVIQCVWPGRVLGLAGPHLRPTGQAVTGRAGF